jgi:acyl carrier protein
MSDLKAEVMEIISTIIEKPVDQIPLDAHLVQDVGADSMMALEILAALEKKYRIVIPEEKLQELTTVNKIIKIVEEKKERRSSHAKHT